MVTFETDLQIYLKIFTKVTNRLEFTDRAFKRSLTVPKILVATRTYFYGNCWDLLINPYAIREKSHISSSIIHTHLQCGCTEIFTQLINPRKINSSSPSKIVIPTNKIMFSRSGNFLSNNRTTFFRLWKISLQTYDILSYQIRSHLQDSAPLLLNNEWSSSSILQKDH